MDNWKFCSYCGARLEYKAVKHHEKPLPIEAVEKDDNVENQQVAKPSGDKDNQGGNYSVKGKVGLQGMISDVERFTVLMYNQQISVGDIDLKLFNKVEKIARRCGLTVQNLCDEVSEASSDQSQYSKMSNRDGPLYSGNNSNNQSNPYYRKALHKIRGWAFAPNQQNHKLIKAYFKAYHRFDEPPTKAAIRQICSDINNQDFYVRDFVGTYNSLKADGERTNGKVFEDDGEYVRIWEEVVEELLNYEKFFYDSEKQ
ncbi:MAG: hypothetical protein IK094_02840 [Treponema sp.]|nr:hypothetical protein [Treponema sp.]